MAPQMQILSEELIQPSSPTPQTLKTHKLSHLDQVLLTCHIPIILFYPNQLDSNLDRAQRSENLKRSLSTVLTQFYPLAGRININSSVDCNDSGVPFLEARVHSQLSEAIKNVAIDELNQYLPFQPYPGGEESGLKKDIPLAVKISCFECGGTAIGVCISHKIADALSLATFLNSWTATCQEETDIVQPNFDLGSHHFPPMESIPAPEFLPDENIVMKRFVFDKEKLEALKAQLASSATEVKNSSRVQIVIAVIWKQFIDVTRAKFDTKNKLVAAQAVNLRSRMNPPFPQSAMGNIATMAYAVAEEDKDFSDLVGPLKTSLAKIDDEHVKELQKGVTYLDYEAEPQELFSFSSWCRLGFYDLDFGWGKPVSVCTTTVPMKNLVYLMDTRNEDGIEAWISMAEDEMSMLSSDFLSLLDTDFSN